ncbi:MAG: exo-alpha-sialidase [Bryobacterales bacterium]|nr:exo-alpha-sialidase [Bryobacterales bacterium]
MMRLALSIALLAVASLAQGPLPDLALEPPHVIRSPWPEHYAPTRRQGVPGIECTAGGRLWAIWVKNAESPRSYVVLATSADAGRTWSAPKLVVQPRRFVRAASPNLWIDPLGRLWFTWAQSAGQNDGRWGVWAIVADNPEVADPEWSAPRRIANGIMLNKPIVLRNGDWLFPIGLWRENSLNFALDRYDIGPYTKEMLQHDLGEERGSNVYRSRDQGRTFEFLGQVRIPGTRVDEHMLIERRDGAVWMLVRTVEGMGQATSGDGGKTWSIGDAFLTGRHVANKRFFVRRLQSGALLLVRNNGPTGARSHLTAFVSDDDGLTWKGGLLVDERDQVTYPDGVQAADGTIYLIYDYNRTPDGVIVLAALREEDIRASRPVTDTVRLRVEIDRLRPAQP